MEHWLLYFRQKAKFVGPSFDSSMWVRSASTEAGRIIPVSGKSAPLSAGVRCFQCVCSPPLKHNTTFCPWYKRSGSATRDGWSLLVGETTERNQIFGFFPCYNLISAYKAWLFEVFIIICQKLFILQNLNMILTFGAPEYFPHSIFPMALHLKLQLSWQEWS